MTQIIYFYIIANTCIVYSSPINTCIRSYFHISTNLNPTKMWNFTINTLFVFKIAKPICSYHNA